MSNPSYSLNLLNILIAPTILILVTLCVSYLKLGLSKKIIFYLSKACTQLLIIGLILTWIFSFDNVFIIILYLMMMTVVASTTAFIRIRRKYKGLYFNATMIIWGCSWFILFIALVLVLKVTPWYSPRHLITVGGMILANMLNGVSLSVDNFSDLMFSNSNDIESILSLGASRWEVALPYIRKSIYTGLFPILNAMSIAGIVSLPGVMTGQIIAGVSPIKAVLYQIVLLCLIVSGTVLVTVLVTIKTFFSFFNKKHQLILK